MELGLSMRAAQTSDAAEITRMRQALNQAQIGQPFTDEAEVRAQLTNPDLELETDWVVVTAPSGEIVGSGTVWPDAPYREIYAENAVHGDWTGQGIGSALLDWAEVRAEHVASMAPKGERVVVRHGVWLDEAPAERLLEQRGYRAVRFFQALGVTYAEAPPEPAWPNGISVRAMVPGTDDRALHDVKRAAFEDTWEGMHSSFEGWIHELTEAQPFDPGLVFIASDGDEPIGEAICLAGTADNPDGGYLADLGVRREWRGRGVATALLQHAFGELFRRGYRHITTAVDSTNPTGAYRIYERLGMTPTFGHSIFEKELMREAT